MVSMQRCSTVVNSKGVNIPTWIIREIEMSLKFRPWLDRRD